MPPRDANNEAEQIERSRFERSRQVRGLLLLALAAIVFAIVRAGAPNVFTSGWWRLW